MSVSVVFSISMTTVIAAILALVGAFIHTRRRSKTGAASTIDTYLVWWLVLAIGIGSVITSAAHLFDGPATAEMIGYARGEGGFQFENAMADLSIGIAGILCYRFRGYFWMATLVVASVQYIGDAGGHIYFWIAQDNTKPANIGIPLWFDIILPVAGLTLYAISYKRHGDAHPGSTQQTEELQK